MNNIELPPCPPYAGHEKPGQRRVCKLKGRLVTAETCIACEHSLKGEAAAAYVPKKSTPPPLNEGRCTHLGDLLRVIAVPIGCCGGSDHVEVCACSQHGECVQTSATGRSSFRICESCGDFAINGVSVQAPIIKPAVSIVVPVWNEASRVSQCLRALQSQTFRDFECFIVDDGSTDKSESVIRALIRGDSRFSYFKKPHGGIGSTLNAGFNRCTTDLLTWTSADSWVEPTFLEMLKAALDAHPQKVMAYSDWMLFDELTGTTQTMREPDFDRKKLQSRCQIGVCWMFRAAAKEQAGPYCEEPCEDYYMHMLLSGVGDFVKVPAVLGTWRNHRGNTSNRINVPNKWTYNTIVKAKARWQQAKYRVAYLCPNLDAASVGWLLMSAVNDLSDDFAVHHVLGDNTHVTPGVDARLYTPHNDPAITEDAKRILSECDIVHVNNDYPDFNPEVFALIKDKSIVIHMHAGRQQWDAARLRSWKDKGVPVLTCTPGHAIARWVPNVMPVGDGNLTNEQFYTPIARHNPKLRLLCHHNYPGGKGLDQLADVFDGIDKVLFQGRLNKKLDWSFSSSLKLKLFDHLEQKQKYDLCLDTITHGYCGMASWEAMAQGLAVICRMDEPTQAEYWNCFGSVPPILNPRTVDDLVAQLVPLIDSPRQAAEAGKANRAWIMQHYTADKILALYESIYRGVLHVGV